MAKSNKDQLTMKTVQKWISDGFQHADGEVEQRRGDWIQTFTGQKLYPLDPRPDEIHMPDIAHALSMICRFNGHCYKFYSVAEHSCHVYDYLRGKYNDKPRRPVVKEIAFAGLMHDSSEAYLCDLVTPVKRSADFARPYRIAKCNMMLVIADKFGFPWPFPSVVHEADARVFVTEVAQLMSLHPDWLLDARGMIAGLKLPLWSPEKARMEFLIRYSAMTGEVVHVRE